MASPALHSSLLEAILQLECWLRFHPPRSVLGSRPPRAWSSAHQCLQHMVCVGVRGERGSCLVLISLLCREQSSGLWTDFPTLGATLVSGSWASPG